MKCQATGIKCAAPRTVQPTGIIRTLPSLYGDASEGARRYQKSIAWLEKGMLDRVFIALQCIPRIEVLHIYLIIDGFIDVRLNIAQYLPGYAAECWDKTIREPKIWAVCTAPVSRPPAPVRRKGFQGIRYTEDLW